MLIGTGVATLLSMLALWSSIAFALPPDQQVALWTIGDTSAGAVERMALTVDGGLLVGRTRGDEDAWLVDIDRWERLRFSGPDSTDACSVNGVAPIAYDDGTYEIWLACSDGRVLGYGWDGEALFEVYSDGGRLELEVDTQVSGIWYDPLSDLFYALGLTGSYDAAVVHAIDVYDGVFDTAIFPSYPKTLPADGFVESLVVGGYLITSHGNRDLTTLQLGYDAAAGATNQGSAIACQDMAESALGGVYCVDDGLGTVSRYAPGMATPVSVPLGVLVSPEAVCASLDLTDGWIAVTGTQVKVWEMDENETPGDLVFEGPEDAENPIIEMVTDDGYLYGGGEGGGLHVVTARPWVDPDTLTVEPAAATSGVTVTLTFEVDRAVDYVVNLGGDRHGGGRQLASGTATAGTPEVVALVVDDDWAEGDNGVYVIATEGITGLTGHARGEVSVDNPPDPPKITNADVEFGDGELILSFDGISDEDLDRYEIYVAEAEFTAAEWPTGGPPWDGSTGLTTPIVVQAKGGEHVTKRLAPLENEVTYHIAVRAWDEGGKEGPMSRVVEGKPSKVFNASQLAGEQGGSPCSTGPGSASAVALLGLGALFARRRTPVALLLLLLAPLAHAQPADEEDRWWEADTTPTKANFELRYGNISLLDERIERVYDQKPHDLVMLEIGPQFFHVLEVDLGFGFLQDLSFSQAADGRVSGTRTMLTWWPFALDGTLRAHVVDEQPVVPFARYGWDYLIWSEKWDDGPDKSSVHGAKFGVHYALGANVLLDLFQPGRASFLEAQTGINDSWITIEWRRQRVDAREAPWGGRVEAVNALDFSGDAFTIGLKLDW